MDAISAFVSEVRTSLAAALPDRIHSASFVDHPKRRNEDLRTGIVTALLPAIDDLQDWTSSPELHIVGQVAVREREDKPYDVEQAELALFAQLRAWARNPGLGLPHLEITRVQMSQQIEFPYGWVALRIRAGAIDEAASPADDIYPPTVVISDLNAAHVDIDLKPHESRAEHDKWLAGDYSTSQPELQTTVELKP